jgi:hypothetical protein
MAGDGNDPVRGTVGGVRRFAALVVLVAALGACDRGGSRSGGAVSYSENGLSLTVSYDEPLRTGRPVTWALKLANGGRGAVTLRFTTGKEGDVALVQGGREVYRWSANRLFSQALRELSLGSGDAHTFKLEEKSLGVPPGDYDLVAEVASEPSPGSLRQPVTVH